MSALQILSILVCLVITGEAAALAVGMHIVHKSDNPWISLKNDLMLALDDYSRFVVGWGWGALKKKQIWPSGLARKTLSQFSAFQASNLGNCCQFRLWTRQLCELSQIPALHASNL